ncbi:MAG: CcdB family protein [Thiotrichales bacterium]
MARFDIHRNTGKQRKVIPFVVVVQSSAYETSRRRVVVSLVNRDAITQFTPLPPSPLNPCFTIAEVEVVLNPLEIVSIPVESLGERIGSLVERSDQVIAVLDKLFARARR